MRLFAERAQAALPSFLLSASNCQAVTDICRRLDGLPLAIELAAARVRALTAEQIAARLDDCFRVLGSGHRTELPRHQTLRAAIDWSYDLLTDAERRLLRRLSVFVDSFTLEAAEDVAAGLGLDGAGVIDLLSHLIDKSLVHIADWEVRLRYRLLETVRQYAWQKLLASEDMSPALAEHADHYLRLVQNRARHQHVRSADLSRRPRPRACQPANRIGAHVARRSTGPRVAAGEHPVLVLVPSGPLA